MNRDEAIGEVHKYKFWSGEEGYANYVEETLSLIDEIYDDFENQVCSNCKELKSGIGCEIYPCVWTWLSTHENEFGCNQWKPKGI